MLFFGISFLLVACAGVLSYPTVHGHRKLAPPQWSHTRRLESSVNIPLRFGLKQPNLDKVEQYINDVSHPDSPNYGRHWTASKIARTFMPGPDALEAVSDWLLQSGINRDRIVLTPSRSWIELNATVPEAEHLLSTTYHVYRHDETGQEHIACETYYVPSDVASHLDIITPSIHFDAIVRQLSNERLGQPGFGAYPTQAGTFEAVSTTLDHCDSQITPVCLRALYNFGYFPLSKNNSFGIVEYTPQAYLQSDLNTFFTKYSTELVGSSPNLISVDGGVVQTSFRGFGYNGESNLDLQYAMDLVTVHQNVTLYQVGDLFQGASFNNFLDALDGTFCSFEGGDDPEQDAIYPDHSGYNKGPDCGIVKPASVISTSYGYNEADLSPEYTARQCAEYAKLGLMGVTVLYSSGDNGVAGNGGLCLNEDGSQSTRGKIFNPSFPGGCPYVTSVGATQVSPGKTVTDPESACEQIIYSGGGFSNYFGLPDYQKEDVTSYLANYTPPYSHSIYNASGHARGFPDISANGANYLVVINGILARVYGTSASSPVIGAILTMINDARLLKGKSPIGFINPALYSTKFKSAFNDITIGGNQGCNTAGFTSVPGWDPVTGLGTPNFPVLLDKWLELP